MSTREIRTEDTLIESVIDIPSPIYVYVDKENLKNYNSKTATFDHIKDPHHYREDQKNKAIP